MAQEKITLASRREEISRLESLINKLAEHYRLPDGQRETIMLALNEAATNAIVHGNKNDPNKEVTVTAEVTPERIEFTVADQGQGFDPGSLPSPLDEPNLMKPSGRGVFLMRQFADEVRYSDKGNRVTLSFNRDDSTDGQIAGSP